MTTLMVRNVDPMLKEKLRVRAAHNGRSMEAELRCILSEVLVQTKDTEPNLADSIRRRFAPFGGVELPTPPSLPVSGPPDFDW